MGRVRAREHREQVRTRPMIEQVIDELRCERSRSETFEMEEWIWQIIPNQASFEILRF